MMWQEAFIRHLQGALEQDTRVIGSFLTGSFGSGQADATSDIDFLAIVRNDEQAECAGGWRQVLEAMAPAVFCNELQKEQRILNAITQPATLEHLEREHALKI